MSMVKRIVPLAFHGLSDGSEVRFMHGNLQIKPTHTIHGDWYMYTHICLNLMVNVGKYTIHEDSMGNATFSM